MLTEVLPKYSVFQPDEANYRMEGYDVFLSNIYQGRGCAIFVKQNLTATKVSFTIDFKESIWCHLSLKGKDKLLCGCIYRSPNSSLENNQALFELMNKVKDSNYSHLLITGDFNCKEIDWKEGSMNMNENHVSSLLLECIRDCFLYQHVTQPTRFRDGETPSLLDLVLTNEDSMVNSISYMSGLGKSDHVQLTFDYNCYIEVNSHSFRKYNFFKGDYDGLSWELADISWDVVLDGLDLANSWEVLTETITRLVEKYVPESRVRNEHGKKNPCINQECLEAIKRKHTKWKKYQYCMNEQNYELYKQARNRVTMEMRRSKYNYEKNLASKIKTDSKLFWSYVRSKLKTKSNLNQLKQACGTLTNDNQLKANLLNCYFASVFEIEEPGPLPDFPDREFMDTLSDIIITDDDIKKVIVKLKASKSQGPDNLHPKLIKECLEQLIKPLKNIFTKSLNESKLPEVWKQANVTAIFKSGEKINPENYRPISLTSVVCKLLERLIRDSLLEHMISNDFFSPFQHGFIPGKSCVTQLLETLEEITEAIEQGFDVDIIYLDFCKAFDKIPHRRLMKKIWAYGIRGKTYKWIEEFLKNRIQRVVVCGSFSSYKKVTSGIPQGSVLGPILFLIFINDLPEVIQTVMRLYADDSKLLQRVKSIEDVNNLQTSLNNSVKWAKSWQMTYNYNKCHHLHIGKKYQDTEYVMETTNGPVKVAKVDSEKDLGVIFDSSLKFGEHINSKVTKANQILGLIFRTFTYMDKEMFLNLFKSLIRPHLEYATTVWSPVYKKDMIQIENVQRRATRLVTSLQHLSYPDRLRNLGLPTLEYRRDRADMIQVFKILNNIDKVDKNTMFQMSSYEATRGHSQKIFKKRYRLKIRGHFFSNRIIDNWNLLPDYVVNAPSLNSFKSRLNKCWSGHPYKFEPWCYSTGERTRIRLSNQNASTEVLGPGTTSTT